MKDTFITPNLKKDAFTAPRPATGATPRVTTVPPESGFTPSRPDYLP